MLKDKVIVITGGAGVICSELANFLAKKNTKIALLDLNYDKVVEVAKSIEEKGFIAKGYKCNVLDLESIKDTKKLINKELGSVDILINGAGGNSPKATTDNEYHEFNLSDKAKDFFNLDKEGIEFVFDLNILGTILPTKVFAKDMIDKKGCSILNISSMSAYIPLTKIPAYSAAKSAVSNFTLWSSTHFSKVGIRVNAIAPGFLRTHQNEKLLFNEDGSPTNRTKKILNSTPMNRFVQPEELNHAVEFLINEEKSSAITGIILPIDCGFSSYSGV